MKNSIITLAILSALACPSAFSEGQKSSQTKPKAPGPETAAPPSASLEEAFQKAEADAKAFAPAQRDGGPRLSMVGAYFARELCLELARMSTDSQKSRHEAIRRCEGEGESLTELNARLDALGSCSEERKSEYAKKGFSSVLCKAVPCADFARETKRIEEAGAAEVIGRAALDGEKAWCDLYWHFTECGRPHPCERREK